MAGIPSSDREESSMRKLLVTVIAVSALGLVTAGVAVADDPFLCPIVGDGVLNADANNGEHGVAAIEPPAGTSLIPGKNQAGVNANPSAYNANGGPEAGNSPGAAGFTPIWNP
jgi:hypothetical protein